MFLLAPVGIQQKDGKALEMFRVVESSPEMGFTTIQWKRGTYHSLEEIGDHLQCRSGTVSWDIVTGSLKWMGTYCDHLVHNCIKLGTFTVSISMTMLSFAKRFANPPPRGRNWKETYSVWVWVWIGWTHTRSACVVPLVVVSDGGDLYDTRISTFPKPRQSLHSSSPFFRWTTDRPWSCTPYQRRHWREGREWDGLKKGNQVLWYCPTWIDDWIEHLSCVIMLLFVVDLIDLIPEMVRIQMFRWWIAHRKTYLQSTHLLTIAGICNAWRTWKYWLF